VEKGVCGVLRVVVVETGEVFGELGHGQTCGAGPVCYQRFIA